jgi:hypothetical protein
MARAMRSATSSQPNRDFRALPTVGLAEIRPLSLVSFLALI